MRTRVYLWTWLLVVTSAATTYSQTSIDLRTQSKTVDFSTSIFTKPVKVGTALPATCSSGEMFFNTLSAPGKNLYACIATNVWTSIGGNEPHIHSLTDLLGITGKQGNSSVLQSFGGGAVGVNDCAKFDSAGNIVSAGAPCGSGGGGLPGGVDGQIQVNNGGAFAGRFIGPGLVLDGSALGIDTSLVPQKGTANTFTAANTFQSTLTLNGSGSLDASAATSTRPVKAGIQFPALCSANVDLFIKTDTMAGQQLYICNAAGTGWNLIGDGTGVTPPGGVDGQIQVNSGGTFSGRIVGPGLTLNGSALGIDTSLVPQKGTANTFTAANTFQSALTLNGAGSLDASAATSTRPVKAGTQFPASCSANVDLFIKTDAAAGQQLYICNIGGTGWMLIGDGRGTPGGADGQIQVNNGGAFAGRIVGPGLALNGSALSVDTSIVPQKAAANTFTAANTFQSALTLNGSGSFDASTATSTRPVKAGQQFPGTCSANVELFIKTDATAGQQLYICNGSGTGWNVTGDGTGSSFSFGTATGLGNTTSNGVANAMSRSDHQHKRDVRIAAGGSDVGTRNRINFIQGSNVTLTVEDRAANDEVAVTIAASSGGGGPTQSSQTPAADDCTTDNCTFVSSFPIPAGTLTTAKTVDVLAAGITVSDGTAPTPRFDLLLGTNPSCSAGTKQFTSVSQIPSISINSTRQWHVRASFSFKTVGANGTVLGQGEAVSHTNSSSTYLSLMRFPGAESGESIDTTVDQWICVRQGYPSGMAGDTVSLKQLIARVY